MKKVMIFFIMLSLFSSIFTGNVFSQDNTLNSGIDGFLGKKEISIPFDTSLENAKFQPIDVEIKFDTHVWAKDEQNHAVRIAVDDGSGLNELECQIYNLNSVDNAHINSCCVVFLIPETADGSEKYYVLYDGSEKPAPGYEDHLILEDTHYFYEPISGQKIDFDYFGFWEDDEIIYAIVQKGELLGSPVCQGVLKFLPGSKQLETYNIDQMGLFDIEYGINAEPLYMGSAFSTDITKNVIVDGNLMLRVKIDGTSPNGELRSDNIYTYYHQPCDTKRIYIDAYHEILKDIKVEDPSLLDGTYGGIVSIKTTSASIDKMNVGEIMPSIDLYSEDDLVTQYEVTVNPSTQDRDVILSTEDDIDLGDRAWVSLSDPSSGRAHGIILDKNTGFLEEDDGIQIKAWGRENVKLPGLEADTSNLYFHRNNYEKNGVHNTDLKQGFNINLKIEYVTVVENGYASVDAESDIFREKAQMFPVLRENLTQEETEDVERFSLKCFVHLGSSFPLGDLLSAATGKKIPYIYAEIYKDNSLKSSGSVGRLALGAIDFDMEGKKFIEKIKTVLGIFDLKNSSFFKKIVFPDLVPGVYVVKIFRENPLFGLEHKYIGYAIVDVQEDSIVRIVCRPETTAKYTINDQNGLGVENVKFQILTDDIIISDAVSDVNGSCILKAPMSSSKNPYTLHVLYNGFLIEEQQIKLGLKNTLKPLTHDFSLDLYDLDLNILDLWGLAPEVEVNPRITSDEMLEHTTINAEKLDDGLYRFIDLSSAGYSLSMRYKSFEIEEKIQIPGDKKLDVVFPAEYKNHLKIMNKFSIPIGGGELVVTRGEKAETVEINDKGEIFFAVPPGSYDIKVIVDSQEIAYQNLDIKNEKNLEIITSQESILHNMMLYLGITIAIASIMFIIWKRRFYMGVKILVVGLLLMAIFSPWWSLTGESNGVETNTHTLLYPSEIVSLTSADDALGGSVSVLPEDFTMVLNLLLVLVGLVIIISILTVITNNRFRKITLILGVISFILLVTALGLFYYAMSLVTEIGVGSFMGSGMILTDIPGYATGETLSCNWGPGLGFILPVVSAMLIIFIGVYDFIINKKKADETK